MAKIKINTEELIAAGILDKETAIAIEQFHSKNETPKEGNRLFLIFGVFGALMIGLGIILIIAHNWDQLSRFQKTVIAFIPMVLSQAACLFALIKKSESATWRESSAVLLITTIAACIAMVSQIYHIEGDMSSFLLTWSILSLPVVYLMRSKFGCLIYMAIITRYTLYSIMGPKEYVKGLYWPLLFAILPFYYLRFKAKPQGNFVSVMNWAIPISMLIAFSTTAYESTIFMPIGFGSLLACFYLFGNSKLFENHRLFKNGYLVIGAIGTLILMIVMSFDFYWEEVLSLDKPIDQFSLGMMLIYSFTILAIALLVRNFMTKENKGLDPMAFVFVLLIILFALGFRIPNVHYIVNVLIFGVGILTILKGVKLNHLAILNFGLLMITAIIIARFFDTDFSFIMRGVVFILIGIAFFLANMWMLKTRKTYEQ